MNAPLVTIGLSVYNAANHLSAAIQSVLNQTYLNWELIIVNDGSTDDSMIVVDAFSDKRIRVVNDGKRLGLPARLNQLSRLANGQFYARMDADDVMHYRRIEKQVEFLLHHPQTDLMSTRAYIIDAQNAVVGVTKPQMERPRTIHDILSGNFLIHPSVMGRTGWFQAHPYNERYIRMQDLALWIETVSTSNFYITSECLLFYRSIGVPTLSKYLSTQRTYRYFLGHELKLSVGSLSMVYLYLLSYGKSLIYSLFSLLGAVDYLVKKRSVPLSTDELDTARKELSVSIR
jgi:glycosyltransferase involved in cell wall biosynthesis